MTQTTSNPKTLQLRPLESVHQPQIDLFNDKMAAAGLHADAFRLTIENQFFTMKIQAESPITVDVLGAFLGNELHGGVIVKQIPFWLAGEQIAVAFYKRPLSEGIINRDYAMLGLMIHKHTMRRYGLMYGLGAGGLHQPVSRMMTSTGWYTTPVPFYFLVMHAAPFLRNIEPLQRKISLRIAVNIAAATGAGSVALKLFKLYQRVKGQSPNTSGLNWQCFNDWGDWADHLWEQHRKAYFLIGDRSRRVLKSLYPADEPRFVKLRIQRCGADIGWLVLSVETVSHHKYFGNLRLGSLIDMFAPAEYAYEVICAGLKEAQDRRADLVVINHSHTDWTAACLRAGMINYATNFDLFLSPKLKDQVQVHGDIEQLKRGFYFNRGDGDGPIHLW